MKKLLTVLLLFLLIAPAAFAHDWRKVTIEHAQADYSDNTAMVRVNIDNNLENIRNLKYTVVIPELGLRKRIGPFELDKGKETTKTAVLGLDNTESGEYIVRITINDGNIRRVKHRFITII